jgi:hypothetical protein
VEGAAYLVGVGAQLYALDGAVTSFTAIIDGERSWKNLATLFLRLSAHVVDAVRAPGALFRVLVIEVYPGYASALETGRGPIDEHVGVEAAYRLLDMIGAYCLWSQAAAQGKPLP